MKKAETDLHRPQDAPGDIPAAEDPPPDGDWLALSEANAEAAPGPTLSPLRGGLGRLAAAWRYLADPAERHALVQYAKGSLSHAAQSLRHPPMTAVMSPPSPAAAGEAGAEAEELDENAAFDPLVARQRLDEALAALSPRGTVHVPANARALDRLLGDPPPANDFEASDLLHDCFPRGTRHSDNRVLLAVARNLTRRFGRPGRLPIASGKAWTMLDPAVFADQMAAQLAEISRFVLGWQAENKNFLILEFAEVELIEFLFEHLHPRRHGGLLLKVMDFKVLSARRTGLLRRIPARVRRHLQHGGPAGLAYAQDSATLLQVIERQAAFRPVAEAAALSRAEIERILARLAPPPAQAEAPVPAAAVPPQPNGAAPRPDISQIMQALGPTADPRIPRPKTSAPPSVQAAPRPPQASPYVGLSAAAPIPAAISAAAAPQAPTATLSVGGGRPGPVSAGLPVPVESGRRRFGAAVKADAVMRVLRGEAPERVAAAVGISPDLLNHWRETFLAGGAASLALHGTKAKSRPKAEPKALPAPSRRNRGRQDETSIEELKTKVQALIRTVEDLSGRIQVLPAEPPAALPPPAPPSSPAALPKAVGEPPPGFPAEDPNPPKRIKRTRRPPKREGAER